MLFRVAQALSKSVFEVKHTISINELQGWAKYFQQEPHNSIEIQLAYISLQIGAYMGVKDKSIEDYLITTWKPEKEEVKDYIPTQKDLMALWGFDK